MSAEWQQTACILCECNCGIEVQVEDGALARIRGDKAHPASQGYTCNKAMRLDHYQNGRHRLTSPMRRRADGTYEQVDWDTAIGEIADRLAAVRDAHGGESIFFYGGGGQGNHLGAVAGRALMGALGVRYMSNALAQEKTGEGWVDAHLYGGHTKGDFEHSEVVLFLGKNPWQSQSFPRARVVLKEIAKDPGRAMIVVDPRRTETADMADFHLQVRPGTDAWCVAAMLGVLTQEDLVDHEWLAQHTTGAGTVLAALAGIDVTDFAGRCGVEEQLIRAATRRFAAASSASTYEDLGVQQAPNSTLVSYLNKLLWILTGNFAKPGAMHIHSWLFPLAGQWQQSRPASAATPSSIRRRVGLAAMRLGARPLLAALPKLAATAPGRRLAGRISQAALAAFFEAVGPTLAQDIADRLMLSRDRGRPPSDPARTPVTDAPVLGGLIPASSIADEILTDHPDRLRAMWIESSNPANSLPDSERFRAALDALDLVVVVDVAMTETARCADYVLPASSQFEKWESTLFNVEFPHNSFHLRAPLMRPLPGTRAEPDIHAAVIRALGVVDERLLEQLRAAAGADRGTFTLLFFSTLAARPELRGLTPYLLHQTLGQTLPEGAAATALIWGMSHIAAISQPEAVRRAGFEGADHELGERLFDAIVGTRSGVVFTVDDYTDAWNYVRHPDRRFQLEIDVLLDELRGLQTAPSTWTSDEFPFVLAAGERRDYTANTIFRDPAWRKRDTDGALRINPQDAERLGLTTGARVRVITETGHAETTIEITDTLQQRHVSLPNGMGLDYPDDDGALRRTGVALNELTSATRRDPFAGTPWHKHVPARIETLPARAAENALDEGTL